MIEFKEFTLENGLEVFVREDDSTPMAVMNILYKVGSRDEEEHKTGFAHLFEHLMFGGSKHIPSYDEPLQKVGGENNAFTSPDITNYYITLPAVNLETAFWLESDRMLSLSFDPDVLEVQRKVVIEEFKQRFLNQPYGDIWLKLRPLAYKKHPYRWPTIGKEVKHIEKATMEDVKDFFYRYYVPNNAIMVIAGDVKFEEVKRLSEKWFGPIPAGKAQKRMLPKEPAQTEARKLEVEADVPADAIYKVFHMPGRLSKDYYTADLLSDVLGRGNSSRLYERLVKGKKWLNEVNAYVTGSVDPGLLTISGTLNPGVKLEEVDREISSIVSDLLKNEVPALELEKIKNKAESSIIFGNIELLNQAMNIAFGAFMGNPNLINEENQMIQEVTASKMKKMAKEMLVPENSSTIYYRAKKK
ncbi:M16 family metallopeptidase [Xanthovirga aplysinae]|uniref:M16 family metallopeptidase n=1 Tax=Xanthovirga aplysinae TaxID=2529853 RepID=UPI0012BC2B7A|nr:pitrilysin family protein [Xanthovirga aplysinae]MTI33070.1 insulinase family protein [Xanthovirga aplysinae]